MQEICLHVEALIKWGKVENDLTALTYHIVPHTAAHSGINSQTLTSKHSHCSINTKKEIVKNISSYLYFVFSSSLSIFSLVLIKCPRFCSHVFWHGEPCERQHPHAPPPADPGVNQTAHGALLSEWQVMQMHILKEESRSGRSTAGETRWTGWERGHALHLLNTTGTRIATGQGSVEHGAVASATLR